MKIIITAIVASLSSNLFAQNKDSIEFHTIENVILYNNKKEIKQTSVSRHNLDVIQFLVKILSSQQKYIR